MDRFIKVNKGKFELNGEPIRLRGFGIGTWLNIEHFMIGLPTPDHMIREAVCEQFGNDVAKQFFDAFHKNFLNEKDFKKMKDCGVNLIRVPFNHRLFIDENNLGAIKEDGFKCIDRLMELGCKYKIYVMLDLHTVSGGQNPDWHSDNGQGVPQFWKYEIFRNQMVDLWKRIATRYANEPYLFGYDLLNEPAMANWSVLNHFYEKAIESIREVDKHHIIVLEGDMFSMEFEALNLFEDAQIAIGFHYYPTVWHPDLLDKTMNASERKTRIASGLDRIVNQCQKFGWPLICGEFGYGKDCGDKEFTEMLIADTVELLEERKIHWTMWCYKDVGFMSMVYPRETSQWNQLARTIQHRWDQDIEKRQAEAILTLIEKKYFPEMEKKDKYLLQFRIRAMLYTLQKKYVLKPILAKYTSQEFIQLTEDFRYDACVQDRYFSSLIAMCKEKEGE